MRNSIRLILTSFIVTLAACTLGSAEEEKQIVNRPDLPEAVLKSFLNSYPTQIIKEYDAETKDSVTYYELVIEVDGKTQELVYLVDGTLVQIEEDVAVETLPKAVVESIKKNHKGCEIDEAMKIMRGQIVEYEVEIEFGEKDLELLVSSDGKILKSKDITTETDDEENAADEDSMESKDDGEIDDDDD